MFRGWCDWRGKESSVLFSLLASQPLIVPHRPGDPDSLGRPFAMQVSSYVFISIRSCDRTHSHTRSYSCSCTDSTVHRYVYSKQLISSPYRSPNETGSPRLTLHWVRKRKDCYWYICKSSLRADINSIFDSHLRY